ncbi:MAG: Sec-independent protein translocase subunit TatA [Nakamurella sp.]
MGGLQWWHIVIIIAAFVLLFGARKLPDAARGVGRSLRILKSEVSAMHEEDTKKPVPAENDASAAQATPAAQLAPAPAVQVPQPAQQPVAYQQAAQAPAQQPVAHQQPVAY